MTTALIFKDKKMKTFYGEKGKFYDLKDFEKHIKSLDHEFVVEVKKDTKIRTAKQNSALHLYFSMLANELNDAGYDMRKLIRDEIDIPWSGSSIKEYLWKPIQKVMLKKKTTTKLTTEEIDKIYDVINKHVSERTGVSIPFPSKKLTNQLFK